MHIDTILDHLMADGEPLHVVQDDYERQGAYRAIMRRLDAINPLHVRSHSAFSIQTVSGGVLQIVTKDELLSKMGPIGERFIPAGDYWMGRENGYPDERPMRHLSSQSFWMMQFPVSVHMYSLAVRAGAVSPGEEWEKQVRRLSCPVVGINMAEVEYFAYWLWQLTGNPWRLPTEHEWEYAARGTDQRLYPWGNDHEPWRANVADQHQSLPLEDEDDDDDNGLIPSLEPIGTRHDGDSPFGISELMGNIDEWTSSVHAIYGEEPTSQYGPLSLVVRGGSYELDLQPLTLRHIVKQYERNQSLGFRLVRSR